MTFARNPGFVLLLASVACALVLACHRKELTPKGSKLAVPSASASAKVAERGAELYGRMCAVCHGAAGEGYKADQAPKLALPDFLAAASDTFLKQAIDRGRSGTTMSAWGKDRGGPLARADTDAVVAHLRTFSSAAHAKLDERPLLGEASEGEAVYAQECQRCHGEKGNGGPNIHIANPEFLLAASNGFLRYAIQKGRLGTDMPAFENKLSDEAIEDLVSLIRSWQTAPEVVKPVPPPPLPLGPVPLNPKGHNPASFLPYPQNVKADGVKAELDRGARMALLDARAPTDYVREHIAGAVSVPFYDPSPYFDALPKDAWLVCYCSCPHAESGTLAQKLVAKGFTKVTVLDEGLGYWKSKKYPTQTGEHP